MWQQQGSRKRIAYVQEVYDGQVRHKAEQERRRLEGAEEVMKGEIRREFFKNPVATEEEFEALYPELRKTRLLQDTLQRTGGPDADSLAYARERFNKRMV